MKDLRRVWKYLRPYRGNVALFTGLNIFSVVFSLVSISMVIPFLQVLFDKVKTPDTAPEITFNIRTLMDYMYYLLGRQMDLYDKSTLLAVISVSVIVLFFLKNFTTYMSLYSMAPMRTGVMRNLRTALYHKITGQPLSYFTDQRKGDILTRVSVDVVEVEWSIMSSVVSLIKDPMIVLAFLGAMFFYSPELTLFSLIILPLSAILISTISRSLKRASFNGQKVLSDLITMFEETLGGIRIVKAFHAENYMHRKLDEKNRQFYKVGKTIFRKQYLSSPLSEFMGSIIIATVMWFGGNIVMGGRLDAEVFITYIALFSQIISPAKALSMSWYNLQKGMASLDRIEEVLNAPNTLQESASPKSLPAFTGKIEFHNVSFRYDQKDVLQHISLEIPVGKTIALAGPSGAGKSTLADLAARFYDPTEGHISMDGINLRDIAIGDLRKIAGIVPQSPFLFNDTIAANIAFGADQPDLQRVMEAAQVANAHEFIIQTEKGYDTNIGDLGVKLSGGQRQRIAIARAIYHDYPFLILDEATSSLDTESERLVQDALNKLMKDRTVLVIAHRLSTIQQADQIIVMNEGKIAETGTHTDLLRAKGLYARLYEMHTLD